MGLAIAVVFGAFVLVGRWAVQRRTTEPGAPIAAAEPGAAPEAAADPHEVWRVPFGGAPGRGPEGAPVTIVLFSDLAANAGRRLESMVEELQTQRPSEVRWAVRFVTSAPTTLASEALLAAFAQGKYFELREAIGARIGHGLSRADVDAAARSVGLDTAAFSTALDTGKAAARARADSRLAATLGVTRPTLFVNGEKVAGPVTAAQLARVVARQRKRAEAFLRRGVKPERVYVELTRNGRTDMLEPGAKRAPRRREDPNAVYRVDVGDAPVRGPADAILTIVEFGDFQCPFCLRAAPILRDLLARYPADVRLVWMDSPLSSHPEGRPAAVVARAAHAQGKFWAMHDALFEAQRALGRETYERLAREQHLDLARFHADLGSDRLGKAVLQQAAIGARLGVIGTPVFFVNGKRLRTFRSPDDLRALVERELQSARALVRDQRIRPADVYEHLTRNGALRPVFLPAERPAAPAAPTGPRRRSATVDDLRPGKLDLPTLPSPAAPPPPP